jgi:hypothetical protein
MSRPLKIRPLNVDVNAALPEGGVLAGYAPMGLPIYRVKKLVTKNEPRRSKDGEVEYAKHPTTGEPLYQKRKVEWEYVDGYVVPNQQGNGNLSWDDYTPPTPEEIAAADREKRIAELIPVLGGVLVDNDVTPEQLVAALRGAPAQAAPAAEPKAEIPPPVRDGEVGSAGGPEPEFPKALPGVGRWELSNGEVYKGTKIDAIAAEKALQPPEF